MSERAKVAMKVAERALIDMSSCEPEKCITAMCINRESGRAQLTVRHGHLTDASRVRRRDQDKRPKEERGER